MSTVGKHAHVRYGTANLTAEQSAVWRTKESFVPVLRSASLCQCVHTCKMFILAYLEFRTEKDCIS